MVYPRARLAAVLMVSVVLIFPRNAAADSASSFGQLIPPAQYGPAELEGTENGVSPALELSTPSVIEESAPPEIEEVVPLAPRCAEESCTPSMWLVSTRELPCDGSAECPLEGLVVRRLEACDWQAEDLETLTGESGVTVVYVHGNRYEPSDALEVGRAWYRRLVRHECSCAFRFVIWSWPSAPERGVLRDLRKMAHRSELQGRYLAEFISQLPPTSRVVLVGHSYGARLISASLHMLGGGTINQRSISCGGPGFDRCRVRAVMLAAAVDCDWMAPGRRHGAGLLAAERVLVLKNHRDPLLLKYHLLYRCSNPHALGVTGVSREVVHLGSPSDTTGQAERHNRAGRATQQGRPSGRPGQAERHTRSGRATHQGRPSDTPGQAERHTRAGRAIHQGRPSDPHGQADRLTR